MSAVVVIYNLYMTSLVDFDLSTTGLKECYGNVSVLKFRLSSVVTAFPIYFK